MRKYVQFFLILLCQFLLSQPSLAAKRVKSNGIALDKIVVVLNNSVITQTELNEALTKAKNQLIGTQTPLPAEDILRKQVLDQLINRKLQLDLAQQANIQINDKEIDKAVETIATRNHISTENLYASVANQGLSRTEYRQELHDEMTIQKVQQDAVASKITITPQEVDDFMRSAAWLAHNTKEYHLEDILVALPENPSSQDIAAAKTRADNLLIKLHQGTPFREVAVSESGESNALQGGDLGWRKLPEIPSAFSNSLIQAQANDIIGPIQTANGFHIVHIAGIRKSAEAEGTPKNKHQLVQQLLFQRKFEEALQSWITKIRSEAFINMHPDV
ncbi:MAG: peptidylprolyl isomerase [Gammaproteobacteria bacterium]|nr:peptidylprolyl isomerase [Gammaproteobacteria bacterium]